MELIPGNGRNFEAVDSLWLSFGLMGLRGLEIPSTVQGAAISSHCPFSRCSMPDVLHLRITYSFCINDANITEIGRDRIARFDIM